MAFSPIAFVAPNYRDYKNWWLKAYEPGTTTPKVMADNDTGTPTVAKYEINKDGFIESSGGTLVIPFIDGAYDLWLFPTEAEADANNTTNAERVADDIDPTGESVGNVNKSNVGDYSYIPFDNVADLKTGTTSRGESITLIIGDRVKTAGYTTVNDGGGAEYMIVAGGTGTDDGGSYHDLDNGLQAELKATDHVKLKVFGAVAESDILSELKAAQAYLVTQGGGKITIDIDGWVTMSDELTVDATYADYALDVESNIEITANPNLEIRADKTKGGDIAGYCLFHIKEKENIKIHGFYNINGLDYTTNKGIGQIVAIRGDDDTTRTKNVDIYDITWSEIRDEPFRLGQTTFAGQIGQNVNIWNIRGRGCSSHGVVMRSMLSSTASGLQFYDTGRLGIDISSYCVDCHLHGGRGHNRFVNTTGAFKIDGGAGKDEFTLSNFNCTASDVYYDGGDGNGNPGNGSQSVNGYLFRIMCRDAVVANVYGKNCGGAGINLLTAGDSSEDNMNLLIENVTIDTITNGDGSDASFNGKSMFVKHDSVNDLGVTFKNVEIKNSTNTGKLDASGVFGDIKLDSADTFVFNDNSSGSTNNINLSISLVDSVINIVDDVTNGGSNNVNFYIKEFSGDTELDIENSSKVKVSGNGYLQSTRTRQIRLDGCDDFHVSGLSGEGTSMVWISGTMLRGIVQGLIGDYSDGLIFETGATAYTSNKGLYANCINSGAGGYVISSTATQDNLL